MSTRHWVLALALAVALGVPAAAGAQDFSFTYLEGGCIAGFRNDVEESWTSTENGSSLELETDSGGGNFDGGSWQLWANVHLFGDYSLTSQDLEVSDGIDTVNGDFDVVRWRIFDGALNTNIRIDFLRRLIKGATKKVFLILDNLRVQHAKPVKAWLAEHAEAIEAFYLPSYSPELNLDEMANADLKQAVTKLAPPARRATPA